ncbi:TPA: transcriptional regulator HilD [Salmonella enterica]|nr:transcriptional regulator HilD [Salmonella enterica]HBK1093727.1 transcriptional regulator HilD [Salmonella enterica]
MNNCLDNHKIPSLREKSISQCVSVSNFYVASLTLAYLRHGCVAVTDEWGRASHCIAPGIMVLERDQFINIDMQEVEGHLSFDVIEVPHYLLTVVHEVLIEKLQTEYQTGEHPLRMVYTGDYPVRKEVFELLKNILSENRKSIENEEERNIATFSLLLLLSGLINKPAFSGIIRRSVKLSVKYRVYNLLYTEPDRQWKLNDVSSAIFMSSSTLKRKLASEGTTFSELYITARMNLASKLLRTGKYSVTNVAVLCGYDSVSYFIACFKRQFSITPLAFMKSVNH